MDRCVFILREPSSHWNEVHDDVLVIHLETLVFQAVCMESWEFMSTIKSTVDEAHDGRTG